MFTLESKYMEPINPEEFEVKVRHIIEEGGKESLCASGQGISC